MTGQFFKYVFLLAGIFLIVSCSVTRRVPAGSYLMTKNIVEEDKEVPKKERIRKGDVEKFIQPKPNKRFIGTNLYLQLHNMANPDTTKKNWWNRTLRKLGEAPVLLDSSLVVQSTGFMRNYIVNSGFFDAGVTYRVDTLRKKKAKVTYTIKQNTPYRIGDIKYEFKDESLRPVIMQDSSNSLIHSGNVLNSNTFSDEKVRVTDYMKNNGYFDFNHNNIKYFADPTPDPYVSDVTIEFLPHLVGHAQREAIYENNSVYRINKLIVNPDYDPMKMATDPSYYLSLDTMDYRGLHILYPRGKKPNVRPRILRQAINLYPNYIYSTEETQQAYSNIMRLGYYKNVSIVFDPAEPGEEEDENMVTFIGGDGEDSEEGLLTKEKYLSAHINCIPALRQSYKIELEGTTSSNFNAISATVGYQNRNLFRGVELFDISVKGGYEFLRVKNGKKSSFEFGAATSMSFPRFIFPFKIDPYNKTVNPRTKVELSVNSQRRPFYNRTVSSVNWGYSWSNRGKSSFIIRPIDVNLVKLNKLDTTSTFYQNIHSEYLRNSYKSQLVAGMSGSYIYNSQMGSRTLADKSLLFRVNWEVAGNLINLVSRMAGSPTRKEDGEEYYKVFGIRYAQYFRFDASVSNRIMLGPAANLAFRVYGGLGKAYSNAQTIPFDRFFYAGGSNSMRGWVPRTLGPGNTLVDDEMIRYPNQVGNVKLEANVEFRAPIWDILHGAVFFDLGNVWYLDKETSNREAVFRFNRFYRQLGLNTGLGIRFDIGMAVIRFDWGMKLHNPNAPKGRRWGHTFPLSNTTLNFGVGYPF